MTIRIDADTRFWTTYLQQHAKLLSYCLRLLNRHKQDAEDALSAATLKAYEAYTAGRVEVDNLNGWLYTIARNCCMDVHRRRDSRWQLLLSDVDPEQVPDQAIADDPAGLLIEEQAKSTIFATLQQVSPIQRKVVYLRLVDQLPHKSIAAQLKISSESSRKHLEAFRKQVRYNLAVGEVARSELP